MNRIYEKSKIVFLILFVFLSIFQVGILWSYQNQGFPIGFLSEIFASRSVLVSNDEKGILYPSRIIVSSGFDEPYFVLEPYDVAFGKTWQELRLYLRDTLVEPRIVSTVDYTDDDWVNIIFKKAVVVDFNAKIDIRLLCHLMGLENVNEIQIKSLYKMAIGYDESNSGKMAMYITDGIKICKFDIKPHQISLNEEISNNSGNNSDNETDTGYKLLKEIFPRKEKAPWSFRPEIPVYVLGEKFVDYNNLEVSLPLWMSSSTDPRIKLGSISKAVLGVDKDSYDNSIDDKGNYIFANIDNIYRINNQGVLEYTYLGDKSDKDVPDIASSFEKAMNFINARNLLMNINDIKSRDDKEKVSSKNDLKSLQSIYLSGVEFNSKEKKYIFDFNYSIGEIPVIFDNELNLSGTMPAIHIEVDSSRVIYCVMIIKKLQFTSSRAYYDLGFKDFSTKLYKKFDNKGLKQLSMEDTFVGYSIDSKGIGIYEPSWIIRTFENGFYSLSLYQKKGD